MFLEMLPVLIGGLLAIAGSAVQSLFSSKSLAKQRRLEKCEKAYLDYIDALLKIEISENANNVETEDFWDSALRSQAQLRLYGSNHIISMADKFEQHLWDFWDYGAEKAETEKDAKITEELRSNLIAAIRNELHID